MSYGDELYYQRNRVRFLKEQIKALKSKKESEEEADSQRKRWFNNRIDDLKNKREQALSKVKELEQNQEVTNS